MKVKSSSLDFCSEALAAHGKAGDGMQYLGALLDGAKAWIELLHWLLGHGLAEKGGKLKMFSVPPVFCITFNGRNASASSVSQKMLYSDLSQITILTFSHSSTIFSIYNITDRIYFAKETIYQKTVILKRLILFMERNENC